MFNFLRRLSKKEAKKLESCLAQNGLEFDSQEAAEKYFFSQRDNDLYEINELNSKYPQLELDFKARSLARFEGFYFHTFVDKSIAADISKERMEELLTQYMRQLFVVNDMAEWMVFENDFAEGRYELGIMYGYGSGTTEHYANGLDKRKDNTNRTHLFNDFMLYVPEERQNEVL